MNPNRTQALHWRCGACFLLIALLLAACAADPRVIVVDEAHFTAFKQGDLNNTYEVPSGNGFTVDATGYPFLIPMEAPEVPGPNMIQLTTADGAVFNHPWNMQNTRYELSSENLINPVDGAKFPGLAAGESYLLGIGYLDGEGRFTVLWAAVVDAVEA